VNKRYEGAIFNMAKQDIDESYEGYFDKLRAIDFKLPIWGDER
jgi:hypothetical protein